MRLQLGGVGKRIVYIAFWALDLVKCLSIRGIQRYVTLDSQGKVGLVWYESETVESDDKINPH